MQAKVYAGVRWHEGLHRLWLLAREVDYCHARRDQENSKQQTEEDQEEDEELRQAEMQDYITEDRWKGARALMKSAVCIAAQIGPQDDLYRGPTSTKVLPTRLMKTCQAGEESCP